jgi:putative ABC transport system substrate-binding protein
MFINICSTQIKLISSSIKTTLLSLIFFFNCQLSAETLTIIYPDVDAPYDIIFNQIKSGIASEFKGEIIEIKLPVKFDNTEVVNSIITDKVIALGKRGWIIAKQIYKIKPVVVGALPIKPNGISGVSLMASPEVLFNTLKELAPAVKTITVLYSKNSSWLIEKAKFEAQSQGFNLNPIQVDDIREAVQKYDEIFANKNSEHHAIWLPLDPVTADDKIIVPVILEKAWENKMVVFSSKPTHAKRGALFSAVPDNELLGHQLAKMVNKISKKPQSVVTPMHDIKLAVNLRTAAHLGFAYNASTRSTFALTFPN